MIERLKHTNWQAVVNGIIWIISLAGLVTLMSFIGIKSKQSVCTNVRVIIPGEQSFVERADIDQLLKKQHGALVGRSLQNIPVHTIESELKSNPFVEKVLVYMDMDGVINIQISQREARIRIINQAGADFYVDQHGLKMPTSLKYAPKVITANGYITEPYNNRLDTIKTTSVKDLYLAATFIQKDSLWNEQVEQLYVDENQDIELISRVGNQKIILGTADSLDVKFEKLMLFYKQIIPRTGWDAYKTVNLKFANQIVCEKANTNNIENRSNNSIISQ
ncbi:cell division protein FtsQ [bacterium A37T11]|nr:cell division protein FtsQ [bacterium A37T11]